MSIVSEKAKKNKFDSVVDDSSENILETTSSNSSIKNEIFESFKKIYSDLDIKHIHNYYFCLDNNCTDICSNDLKRMAKDNKFQHKWLFDRKYGYCENTKTWNLVYINGKSMFCTTCRKFDAKQMKNGNKQWNCIPSSRCRASTIQMHLKREMHNETVSALNRLKTSYFDTEEKKKINSLKNDVYFKVFQSLYWLAKEEMPSRKINSLLTLVEKLGINELKHFETRSEPVLRKMLLMIAQTIIESVVSRIKESDVYGFLTDEVTDISNICQLVSFVKIFDKELGQADTIFLDCSNLLSYSPDSSPNAEAIVECMSKRFEELYIEISKLMSFASDGASVMV